MSTQIHQVRQLLYTFLLDFINNPYICYTEHGLHALFFAELYHSLPPDERFTLWKNHKVCVIQKEYPTAGSLGKSKRQHWDIAIIKTPPQGSTIHISSYDYLRLSSVIEFAINEDQEHLQDDIDRVCHEEANIDQGFIVQLYRLSQSGARFSQRDWASKSKRITPIKTVADLTVNKPVEVMYGIFDSTGRQENGLWHIMQGQITEIPANTSHRTQK